MQVRPPKPLQRTRAAFCLLLGTFVAVRALSLCAQEPPQPAAGGSQGDASLQQIVLANSIVGVGKIPFHLQATFQLFGLDGRPSEKGTLEEWWSESSGDRLEVTAPSFGKVQSFDLASLPNDGERRALYLVSLLHGEIARPGLTMPKSLQTAPFAERKIGGATLRCVESVSQSQRPESLCVDSTDAIRYVKDQSTITVRNKDAKFNGSKVALHMEVGIAGRPAISGDLTSLTGFDPATAPVALEKPAASASNGEPERMPPGSVVAGNKISGSSPVYPLLAKQQRITGTVVLHARISTGGDVAGLFALASPDPSLTEAAVAAVKGWRYEPYLLNGSATAVDTTITVNFNLSSTPVTRF